MPRLQRSFVSDIDDPEFDIDKLPPSEYQLSRLYSCYGIGLETSPSEANDIRVFGTFMGKPVPGLKRLAERVHTNLFRPGESGLPKDWAFYVTSVAASINLPRTEAVDDYLSSVSVQFYYNARQHGQWCLLDLVNDPSPVAIVHVREQLIFEVNVRHDPAALRQFKSYLNTIGPADFRVPPAVVAETIRQTALDLRSGLAADRVVERLTEIAEKIQPTKTFLCWISLIGRGKASVM